jgi:hypothetical protein
MLPQKHRSAHNVIVLLDELRSVRNEADPCEHRSHAHGAIEAVGSWIAAGEFEASAGRLAIVVLEPEACPEDPALRVVSALFAEVAASRRDWGERPDSVVSDLNSLLKEDAPGQQAKRARPVRRDREVDRGARCTANAARRRPPRSSGCGSVADPAA